MPIEWTIPHYADWMASALIALLFWCGLNNRKQGWTKGERIGWVTEIWMRWMLWRAEEPASRETHIPFVRTMRLY